MKKKEAPSEKWERLTKLARQAPRKSESAVDASLPPGFSTRVAAQWSTPGNERGNLDLLERVGRFGAALAAVIGLICVLTLESPSSTASNPLVFDALLFAPPMEAGEPLFLN